jgi:epoxyqueuosine reductase
MMPRAELVNPALDWLAEMDEAAFAREFNGSPVKRTKLAGMRRNVAIAMGNSGLRGFLPKLREWAGSSDEVLAEAADWAIGEIEAGLEVGVEAEEVPGVVTPQDWKV